MALGALMAADPMKQLPMQVVQNPPVIFTTITTGGGHRRHLSSFSKAAKPTASPSDLDVAAAQQLVQLSSDGDGDDAILPLPHHRDQLPRSREEAPTTDAGTAVAGDTPKGEESDAAAPALAPRRKRRFASISSIYARTKPLKVRGSSAR